MLHTIYFAIKINRSFCFHWDNNVVQWFCVCVRVRVRERVTLTVYDYSVNFLWIGLMMFLVFYYFCATLCLCFPFSFSRSQWFDSHSHSIMLRAIWSVSILALTIVDSNFIIYSMYTAACSSMYAMLARKYLNTTLYKNQSRISSGRQKERNSSFFILHALDLFAHKT